MTNPKFEYKAVPADAMPLMKEYRAKVEWLSKEVARIQREAQAEANRVHAANLEELKLIWYKVASLVGLDAEKTWANSEWSVDTRYIDDGFAALIRIIHPKDPLAAMFGGAPNPVTDDNGGGPPPGVSIN